MFTPDHHLDEFDDRLSLSHMSRRQRRRRPRDRVGALNGVHSRMARPRIVYDASHQSCVEDKLSKPPPPYLKTPKDIGTMGHANFHADRREISVPGQGYICFLIADSPGVSYRPMLCILESSRRADFKL